MADTTANEWRTRADRWAKENGRLRGEIEALAESSASAITEAVAAERKACADAVRALRIGPAFDGAEHPSTRILNKAIAAIEGRGTG